MTDGKDWLTRGCDRLGRPRRSQGLLLPCPGFEGLSLLVDCATLQGVWEGFIMTSSADKE